MSRESGFVVYRLMLILPALLSALCGSVFLVHHLIGLEKVQKQCIEQGFSIQWKLASQIKKLMALNLRAQQLRTQRRSAEVKLVAALATQQPTVISAALNHLRNVILRQVALNAKQNVIRAIANTTLNAWRANIFSQSGVSHIASKAMALRAVPSSSLTPSYYLQSAFSENQKAALRWTKYPHQGFCEVSLSRNLTPIILKTLGG